MLKSRGAISIAAASTFLLLISMPVASGAPVEPPPSVSISHGVDELTLKASKQRSSSPNRGNVPGRSRSTQATTTTTTIRAARAPSKYDRELAAFKSQTSAYKQYLAASANWDSCVAAGVGACQRPADVARPQAPDQPAAPPPGRAGQPAQAQPTQPAITPEQAAYAAVAQLRLTPPSPVIGPSPEINEWKIGAVGYPYWLSAEGDLDPAPVSTTVLDLTVSLDAHLAKTTFDLGDGSRLTCTDLTRKWSPAVEPGAESPACGHTYTEPSLPRGAYTVTAYSTWVIDWSVNGVGGTIPLYQQASTTIPVGELQVLTH